VFFALAHRTLGTIINFLPCVPKQGACMVDNLVVWIGLCIELDRGFRYYNLLISGEDGEGCWFISNWR